MINIEQYVCAPARMCARMCESTNIKTFLFPLDQDLTRPIRRLTHKANDRRIYFLIINMKIAEKNVRQQQQQQQKKIKRRQWKQQAKCGGKCCAKCVREHEEKKAEK